MKSLPRAHAGWAEDFEAELSEEASSGLAVSG